MTYQRIASSCIAEIGYEPSDKTLAIRFHSGREYLYVGIQPQTHEALLASASVGAYFNAEVRDAYPHRRAR